MGEERESPIITAASVPELDNTKMHLPTLVNIIHPQRQAVVQSLQIITEAPQAIMQAASLLPLPPHQRKSSGPRSTFASTVLT